MINNTSDILYLTFLLLVFAYSVGNIIKDQIHSDKYYFVSFFFSKGDGGVFGHTRIKIINRKQCVGPNMLSKIVRQSNSIEKESDLTILFYKRISKREYES